MNDDRNTNRRASVREFQDVHAYAQVATGVVAGLGAIATLKLFATGLLPLAGGALAVTAVALVVVYWSIGRPIQLVQTNTAIILKQGSTAREIPLDDLQEFSASWTDIRRNGVYQNTLVQFKFTDESSAPSGRYNSSVIFDTLKYHDLQAFQSDASDVIGRRMYAELEGAGRVVWTRRLTLLQNGIEFTHKPNSAPRRIRFAEFTRCELDQRHLRIAVNGSDSPTIVEKTGQGNFFPGLRLFERLLYEATPDSVEVPDRHTHDAPLPVGADR